MVSIFRMRGIYVVLLRFVVYSNTLQWPLFTKEPNPGLTKCTLKANGRSANPESTSPAKEVTGGYTNGVNKYKVNIC